jgi:hypothetical protein
VELLLNIVWLSVSLLIVILCAQSVRRGDTEISWSAGVALCLLLVLLFPVISMTDDLQAITAPAEVEHLMRRHHDAPLLHMGSNMLEAVALLSLFLPGIAVPAIGSIRARTRGNVTARLDSFVRAYGVRPPPVAVSPTA